MLQYHIITALLALLFMIPANASAEILTLADAVSIARRANPILLAKMASAQAAGEVPSRMGSLPDPMVYLGLMSSPTGSAPYGRGSMTRTQIGFSQMIPFPGKLGVDKNEAGRMAGALRRMAEDLTLETERNVKTAWWGLYAMDRGLDNLRENLGLLRQLVRVAETKYKLGDGIQQDVLLAQLELSMLLEEEIAMSDERERMAAHLNSLLGRQQEGRIVIPSKVDESLPNLLPRGILMEKTLAARPMLAGMAEEKEAAAARLAGAEKGYLPDFELNASYEFGDTMTPGMNEPPPAMEQFNLMLGFTVPLFGASKQSRLIAQRRKELEKAGFELEDARNMALTATAQAISSFQKAKTQAELLRTGIIPQARQTAESMRAGYEVNKVDFLNLAMAQITFYNYQARYWKILAEANQALAGLIAAVGEENVHE